MLGRLITLSCLVGAANGLFFHIKQGEVKCFVEEVPDETLVSGKTVPLFFSIPVWSARKATATFCFLFFKRLSLFCTRLITLRCAETQRLVCSPHKHM